MSARLDGEDPGLPAGVIERHVASCARCRAFEHEAARLRGALRVARAPKVPDLTGSVLRAVEAEQAGRHARRTADRELRIALVAVALVQIAVALPALLLGEDMGASVHAARHLGSFSIAIAVGLVFVAWRPWLAGGLLPVVAAFVVCAAGATFVDVIAGRASMTDELVHVPVMAGLVLLALLLAPRKRSRGLASI